MKPRAAAAFALRPLACLAATFLWLGGAGSAQAQPMLIDLEALDAGQELTNADLPPGVTLTVMNNDPTHPQKAIIFDSSCPTGCSGGDSDLLTPGSGPGNDEAQGNVLIIAENDVDGNGDGLVDDPDDEQAGGIIRFDFAKPTKFLSVRVIDIEDVDEFPSGLLQELTAGGSVFVGYQELGNNSAQTRDNPDPDPKPVNGLSFVFEGTGAIDDIVIQVACGDGILDPGEECDPPGATCDENCELIPDECGDGVLDPGEQCDPPEDGACPGECRETCACPFCGDGILDPGEECDPPGAICDENCELIPDECGDGVLDPGEQCDPPEDGACPGECRETCACPFCGDGILDPGEECDPPNGADCDETCQLVGVCGDGVLDPGEECDPPDGPEICDNMLDDDANGLIDCADPFCQEFTNANPFCGELCIEGVCTNVRRDPAVIKLPRDGKTGYFRMHGRVDLDGRSVDPVGQGFGISLSNSQGQFWSASLGPGDMVPQGGGKRRFRYRDRAARDTGGGDHSGLYKVSTRFRRVNRADAYTFTIQAYSDDFALATEALMTTQLYGVGGVAILTAEWKKTGRGWRLLNIHLK